ncbi:MAG TPA: 50S ribosomal protein L31 [Gammaproteobacteria bacterium]|jgi:large subunit ribosomal protein L31|nr:50S ribosomal protein L31 [Gammaproteobacteria bacterium]
MKPNIHPEYKDVTVTCSCGSAFVTRSTLGQETLSLEVCAKCHPFYTGTQKIVDAAGRVDRFRQKYNRKPKAESKSEGEK